MSFAALLRRRRNYIVLPALLCCLVMGASGKLCADEDRSELFDDLIFAIAKNHSVDPLLVKAIIWRESKFKARSVGSSGEIGLMQIKKSVASDWAKAHDRREPDGEALYTPILNIEIGTWHFARALEDWKNHPRSRELALAQYNAGRTGLARTIRYNQGSITQTLLHFGYVHDVMGKHSEYLAGQVVRESNSASRLLVFNEN